MDKKIFPICHVPLIRGRSFHNKKWLPEKTMQIICFCKLFSELIPSVKKFYLSQILKKINIYFKTDLSYGQVVIALLEKIW